MEPSVQRVCSSGDAQLLLEAPSILDGASDRLLSNIFHRERDRNEDRHSEDGTGVFNPARSRYDDQRCPSRDGVALSGSGWSPLGWEVITSDLALSFGYPPSNLPELMRREGRQSEKSRLILNKRVIQACSTGIETHPNFSIRRGQTSSYELGKQIISEVVYSPLGR